MTRLLLAQPPPSAGIPDNDYLSKVFLHAQKIAYFLRYGKAWHWVEWTDREGLITAAFDVYSAEDEHLRQICFWLARQMVAAADEAAMRLLIKYGQECSACLRNFLLREIGYNGDIRNPYIRAWAAQLLEDSPPDDKDDLLEMLSLVSRLPPSISSDFCLVLARHLAKPRLVAKLWSYAGPERVECEVVYAERPECLETLWENVLKPHIKHYAAPVLSIIAESFASCRQFWCLSRTDVAAWDDLTISRRDVACASPHLCPQTFHALIDIALACLAWMQENDAELASAFIRIWLGSEAPLLRRLAVHGLSQEEVKAPDQMLDHILAKQWLKDGATTQELTRLIVRAYRSASEGARTRFLAGAALCFGGETLHDETLEQHVAWRMFNLLDSILRGMTPPCSVASARLEDVLARHPDWRNMPMTSGGSVEICSISSIPSPISIAELLARSPAEHLEFLITFKDGDVFKGEPTRGNLCAALSKAIEQQPTWGLQLGELLVARDADAPTDIWHALMQGLSDAPLEDGQWPEVYALVSSSAYPAAMLYDGGHFLLRRIEGKKHQIPDTCLADIGGIYSHLWNKSDQEREPECRTGEEAHWAGQAYKHISGLAVRCSLALALRERGCAPDAWRGLSSGTGDFLSRVIADHHARGTYGRVMLAIMLAHLFYLDPEWTRERIVPLLDWDDQPEAERLWEAHGTNGRVFSDVAQDMLPLYAGTINGWEGLQPAARNGLAEKYVLMLCRGRFPDNERRDLALRVGRCGEPNTKAAFAMMIGEMLRHADRDAKLANWNAWAMPYLSARVADSEQPPRDEELKQMVGWLADVPDFTEYVLTITKSNGRINENVGHHLFRFKKANILKTFPDETLGFLGWLINRVRVKTESLHSFDEMAAQLVSMDKPPAGLENLLNLLCERGSSAALGLEDQLRQKRVKQEAP